MSYLQIFSAVNVMSNRLQIFRERMAAFAGAANPQEAIESSYYVRTSGHLLAEKLFARVALRPASSHLLVGGIGLGKTTQLLIAYENLKQIGDIYPIYIDVSLYTDIAKIKPGVLTAIAGIELLKIIGDSDNEKVQEAEKTIYNIAYGYSEKLDLDTLNFYHKVNIVTGIFSEKNNYGFEKGLIEAVSYLIAYMANVNKKKIVFLFDSLDRFEDSQIFSEILVSDVKAIKDANIGFVIVSPLISLYGVERVSLKNYLDYFYHQPCSDVENDLEAHKFFMQILKARSQDDFIEQSEMDTLVKFSGGILRDLINLTQAAIEEAYISGEDKIAREHTIKAILSFGKTQMIGIANEELEILKKILDREKFSPRTEQDIKLLITRRIIEYEYPKQRYVVHPAIAPIIEMIYA
jgi:hypothetical protein